ncbi:MAG: hypothetical protein JNN01_02545 [Opitutaceae bacterium]|nr:hypothetical protein [Opitutaceae bacterium]
MPSVSSTTPTRLLVLTSARPERRLSTAQVSPRLRASLTLRPVSGLPGTTRRAASAFADVIDDTFNPDPERRDDARPAA